MIQPKPRGEKWPSWIKIRCIAGEPVISTYREDHGLVENISYNYLSQDEHTAAMKAIETSEND